MPAIDFPSAPAVNDEYSFEGRTWLWNGTGWEVKSYPAALQLGSASAPSLYFTGDPNTGLYSPGADQVAITTGGTGRLFVDASGNTHVIAVDGQLSLSKTGLRQYQFRVTGLGATEGLAIRDESGATEIARFTQNGYFTVGGLRIKGSDTQNSIYQAGAFGLSSDNYITIGTGASQAERLRITSDGKVGIGTSSPGDTVEIVSTANGKGLTASYLSGTSRISILANAASIAELMFGDGDSGEAGRISYDHSTDALRFYANAGERARIDSSGRLLVGTSSARGQLGITPGLQSEGTSFSQGTLALTVNSTTDYPLISLARSRGTALGSNTIVANGDIVGKIFFTAADGNDMASPVATIEAVVDGTPGSDDLPGRLVFSTTADGASSTTERLRIDSAGVLQVADAGNISVGTTTGTKIGTATTQKLGFYNKTPVVQPTAVADATDAASVITQLNALLARMRDLGLIAT